MTRQWFFQALAGATALIDSAKRLVAKPQARTVIVSVANGLPVSVGPGDRIFVRFDATRTSGFRPMALITVEHDGMFKCFEQPIADGIPDQDQHLFIADRQYVVTDIRIASASGPAPILWTKTSAGK